MANPEHLAILNQGADVWNKWRENNPTIRPDFRQAGLRESLLSKINLSEANLTGANLTLTHLSRANLTGADLTDTDLTGANLTGANLSGTILMRTDLSVTNLSNLDLTHATSRYTIFALTNLSTVKGLETIKHEGPSSIDTHTLFASQNLPEIFLRGCGVPENLITHLSSLRGQAIDFYSCFISYSHSDKVFARRLHDTLQGYGIRCWLDEKQIKPGHDIASEIDRGIKLWDKTILCCSYSAMEEKWWVQFEMKKALAKEQDLTRERSQHVRAIVPLDLDGYLLEKYSGEYKTEILSRSVASFKGWETDNTLFEREVERVIAALRTDEGREVPPTPKL